jgi:2-polyprenyl-6-hydroxyphenyl methylase/3-demethylubiquinone-9 3-methyltransferase
MNQHQREVQAGDRFEFGANWSRFLGLLDEQRIVAATASLQQMLGVKDLAGKTFLDAGCGSGLFSLAARRLGASVHSFDYDPRSVACTQELKRRFFPDDPQWRVEAGSVLDTGYLATLGRFDVVYSWGVLHHTGSMHAALDNVAPLVAAAGRLFIALYNDQGWISRYWSFVKRHYNRHSAFRPLLIAIHAPYLLVGRFVARALTGRLREDRGMSLWYDMIDWLGGWPFEVARPDDVLEFYRKRGFDIAAERRVGHKLGCNEFVFLLPRTHPVS